MIDRGTSRVFSWPAAFATSAASGITRKLKDFLDVSSMKNETIGSQARPSRAFRNLLLVHTWYVFTDLPLYRNAIHGHVSRSHRFKRTLVLLLTGNNHCCRVKQYLTSHVVTVLCPLFPVTYSLQ